MFWKKVNTISVEILVKYSSAESKYWQLWQLFLYLFASLVIEDILNYVCVYGIVNNVTDLVFVSCWKCN